MFEVESRKQNEITILTKKVMVTFNMMDFTIDAGLEVGKIKGPGEFEIGEVAIRGIATESGKTIYDVEVDGIRVGIIGDIEEGLDDLGVSDVLCTSSVRAVREIEPKMIIAMGNIEVMVTELKMSVRKEKRLKIKNLDNLTINKEIIVLN